jgi:cellulose synthase/poly-beta-1,6-N-acetylglucosamine synthase-like glycosyltransferase
VIDGLILLLYNLTLLPLLAYSLSQLGLIVQYVRSRHRTANDVPAADPTDPALPTLTVQLPVYNEPLVVERLLDAIAALRYPTDRLTIQVLDDSTDETTALIARKITDYQQRGIQMEHIRRPTRTGYKAGALAHGLATAPGELIALFDADFVPDADFLLRTVPEFGQPNAGRLGLVQTRWAHLNEPFSLLTRVQAFGLDAHFRLEQTARSGAGLLLNFNGTAGIWRKTTILDAGGWHADTLTEDLDLSYRAQLRGWQFQYREAIAAPAELPVTMAAFRAQQYRWMKGGAETARKLLGPLLTAPGLSVRQKAYGAFHLVSSSMFALLLLLSVLSVPVLAVHQHHPGWRAGFWLPDLFQINTLTALLFYGIPFWRRRENTLTIKNIARFLGLLLTYIALMLGVSLHNGLAVVAGWAGRKSPFIRTPKFNLGAAGEGLRGHRYAAGGLGTSVWAEGLLTVYFLAAIGLGLYWQNYRLLPLHALLALGFGGVFVYSLHHTARAADAAGQRTWQFRVSPVRVGWLVLSAALVGLLGYGVQREQFSTLILLYGLLFWGYHTQVRSLWRSGNVPAGANVPLDAFLFGAAVLLRLLLLGAMPALSDDYARFVWDGRLLAHGHNPYLTLPAEWVGTSLAESIGLTPALYEALNSPRYYTVYPPANQALFAAAAWLSPQSVWGAVVWLRVWIIGAELGTSWLMVRLLRWQGRNPNLALLYALNPLIILELTGNVHFEGVMVCFSLLAVWLLVRGKPWLSAGALALAVGTKLLPLMALPLVLRQLGRRQGAGYVAAVGGLSAVLFLPFFSLTLVQNVAASLGLYFQSFEFNASVYYLLRAGGYWLNGFNMIQTLGRWLSGLTVLGIAILAFGKKPLTANTLADRLLVSLLLYFLFATTVHPWYVGTLVAVSVFSRYRFALVWSGLVWLSYSAYQTAPVAENLYLVGLEYAVVGWVAAREWVSFSRNRCRALPSRP